MSRTTLAMMLHRIPTVSELHDGKWTTGVAGQAIGTSRWASWGRAGMQNGNRTYVTGRRLYDG